MARLGHDGCEACAPEIARLQAECRRLRDVLLRDTSPPWFDTCQTIDCEAWPTWRVVDDRGRVVRGSYNCDEHRPQEQPVALGDRFEHREPLRPRS